jgi:hypothetical protein
MVAARAAREVPMARKEIDMLVEAARKGCVVVEKSSGVLWTPAELAEAHARGTYQEPSDLRPPDDHLEVSGPYPGCCQFSGATPGMVAFRAVGQTKRFVIFARAEAGVGSSA